MTNDSLDWNCLRCAAQMFNGVIEVEGDANCDHSDPEMVSPCCVRVVDPDIKRCPQCGAGV